MRTGLVERTFLLASLAVAVALAIGCTLDSEGQLQPDASVAGSGGGGGTGGGAGDAGLDQNTPDITNPDVACFWPDKVCDDQCVSFDDPLYGCAPDTCEPCEAPDFQNAEFVCVNNECLPECKPGFLSCDNDPLNGCETDVHTVENCGECGTECVLPNAIETCAQGECGLTGCEPDYADCNNNPSDGCETFLRDINNCGGCGTVCDPPGGTPTCATGECKVSTCTQPNTADCNGDPTDGCETPIDTTSNCGACGKTCGFANDHVSSWQCLPSGGTWDCAIGACETNWGNCDGQAATGCATNLLSAVNHCGGCNDVCSGINTQSRACIAGECEPTCAQGFGDCNGPEPGSGDDGCETSVSTDVNNCGTCDNACNLPNTNELCQQGICGIQSCTSGWGNCDGNVPNGCETNVLTSVTHCGSCNFACDTTGGTPTCNNGSCNISCQAGRGNCDNNAANGCETLLNTIDNCGSCGNACDSTNGTPSCVNGSCEIACNSGYANCDGNVSNGCEVNTNTNADNCGACSNDCSSNHVPTPTCSGGTCNGACQSGYADCDGNKLTNGCEVQLAADPDHCGGCGNECSTANMATRTCTAGKCSGTCAVGYSDCDNDKLANGCEVNTSSDTSNCGGCGTVCSTNHVSSVACVSSVCSGSCTGDWGNCDGNLQPNGCETDTLTSAAHCGACDDACSNNHVPTPTCSGGNCTGACETGWDDCNGDLRTDGCETQLGTPSHCGGCQSCEQSQGGAPSNTNWTCPTGSCVLECANGWLACDGDLSDGCESPESKFTAACDCIDSAACENGGSCLGNGNCSCNGTQCAPGEWCIAGDTCGTN